MRAALSRRVLNPKSQIQSSQLFASTSRTQLQNASHTYICQSCRSSLARPALPFPSTRRFQSTSTSPKPNTIETPFASSPPKTHYDFFPLTLPDGPPPAGPFTIDVRQLRKEFLQLQAKAHPDLHASHNKARAEALSSLINEAYKTLSDPLLRTQYLLRLQDIEVDSETEKTDDKELLMAVMEVREAVEDAESEQELEGLKEENEERIREALEVIERGFKDRDLATVREEAVRLRYWRNCEESLRNWERGKGVVLEH